MREWRWRYWDAYNSNQVRGNLLGFDDQQRREHYQRQGALGVLQTKILEDEEDYRADVLALLERIAKAQELTLARITQVFDVISETNQKEPNGSH